MKYNMDMAISQRKNAGFTLIELMVVIVIISMVATLIVASLISARIKGRDGRRVADIDQIKKALFLYSTYNNGLYPDTTQGIARLSVANTCGTNNKCMNVIPVPPPGGAGNPTAYDYCGGTNNASFTLHAIFEKSVNKPPGPTTASSGCPAVGQTWVCSGATDYCSTP